MIELQNMLIAELEEKLSKSNSKKMVERRENKNSSLLFFLNVFLNSIFDLNNSYWYNERILIK